MRIPRADVPIGARFRYAMGPRLGPNVFEAADGNIDVVVVSGEPGLVEVGKRWSALLAISIGGSVELEDGWEGPK